MNIKLSVRGPSSEDRSAVVAQARVLVSERVNLLLSKALLHVFSFNPHCGHMSSIFTDKKTEFPVNDEGGVEIQVSLIP